MRTRLSFLKWVVNLSKWVSLTRSSKRVCAEMVGFFHRFWLKKKKGENVVVVVGWKILYLKVDNGFMSLMVLQVSKGNVFDRETRMKGSERAIRGVRLEGVYARTRI